MLALMWCEEENLQADFWKNFVNDLSDKLVTSKTSFAGSVTSKVDCNRVLTLWDMHNKKWCVSMADINLFLKTNWENLVISLVPRTSTPQLCDLVTWRPVWSAKNNSLLKVRFYLAKSERLRSFGPRFSYLSSA